MKYKETNPRKMSKSQKKNSRSKKRSVIGKALALIIIMLVICSIAVVLSCTVFFKIENVTASGNIIYSADEIVLKSGVKKGENLFLTTNKNVEDNITKNLPFVDDVKLKRILPNTLEICITEAVEKYCYKLNDVFYSLSENFKVLEEYSRCPKGLILLNSNSLEEPTIGKSVALTSEEEKLAFDKLTVALASKNINISRINITDMLSLSVRVEERFDVDFGSIVDIEKKVAHLEKMIEQIEEGKTGTINLSAWSPDKNESYFVQGNLQQ